MSEGFISKTIVLTCTLWATVLALMLGGWLLIEGDHWRQGGMMAATGCATSALAATMHIRLYALRMCGLIRLAHGLDRETVAAELHSIR